MRYMHRMRTTLSLDDDVLAAAKALARLQGRSLGAVVSSLARTALHPEVEAADRNGVPLLPTRDPQTIVTIELVNALRDEAP
jgi:hypothetical protein